MIVVAGDSWACGEWHKVQWGVNYLSHTGLTQMLHDSGRPVANIATPGASPQDIWLRLRDFLRQNQHHAITSALVFQVELTRDQWFFRHNWNNGFRESSTVPIDAWYKKLSELAVKHDIDIWLIGGSGETWPASQVNSLYARVKVACQSLTNLLIEDDPNIDQPILAGWDESTELTVRIMKENSDSEEVQLMLDEITRGHARLDRWSANRQWFFPDGVHPNLQGHAKLFNYLLTQSYI